jgi:hypothetical protein
MHNSIPLLMTEDRVLWTPECEVGGEPNWAGKMNLTGETLYKEINRMVSSMKLGDEVATKLINFHKALRK